jgi:hypothetical protein
MKHDLGDDGQDRQSTSVTGRGSGNMDGWTSRPGLGIGIGVALVTTALSGVVLALGASWPQWLGIAAVLLLLEGILLAVVAYRGPRAPRTRVWPMTAADAYAFEHEWRQRQEEVGHVSRRSLRMALPPLVLGVILFVLSASV